MRLSNEIRDEAPSDTNPRRHTSHDEIPSRKHFSGKTLCDFNITSPDYIRIWYAKLLYKHTADFYTVDICIKTRTENTAWLVSHIR